MQPAKDVFFIFILNADKLSVQLLSYGAGFTVSICGFSFALCDRTDGRDDSSCTAAERFIGVHSKRSLNLCFNHFDAVVALSLIHI